VTVQLNRLGPGPGGHRGMIARTGRRFKYFSLQRVLAAAQGNESSNQRRRTNPPGSPLFGISL
jgi:hypothetical protein